MQEFLVVFYNCQFAKTSELISFSGDRVLEINGVNLEQYNRKQAVQLLRASPSPVRIILERYKGAGAQLDERAMAIEQDIVKSSVCKIFYSDQVNLFVVRYDAEERERLKIGDGSQD